MTPPIQTPPLERPRLNPFKCQAPALCLLLALCLLSALPAAQAARLALVIGNDSYTHVDKLQNARNDARLMAQTLREAQFEVTTLENQDSKNLFRALETFGKRVQSGDEVVFFFAGHGVQINNDAVLLPTDIRAESDKQVLREGLQLSDVQDALKDAKVSLLVIDACRDNPFPKQGTRSIGGTRGLIAPEVRGQAVILSAGRNQRALDRVPGGASNNGLFTHEFVKSIKGGLDLRAALVQVRDRVDDSAKRANHDQRPSVVDDLRGNFYFFAPVTIVNAAPAAPSAPAVRLQSAEEIEQQVWDATQQASTAAAFNAYLTEYPRGRFAAAARVRLAGLMPAPVVLPAPVVAAPIAAPQEAFPAGRVFTDCAGCPDMVVIPTGSFTIGSSVAEQKLANAAGAPSDFTDQEENGIAMQIDRFALAQIETTRGQFARFIAATQYRTDAEKSGSCFVFEDEWIEKSGANWRAPGFRQTDQDPVVCVSWNDAQAYVEWVNTQVNTLVYRLPSEAQWEYAARAQKSSTPNQRTAFHTGDRIGFSQANYNSSASYNASGTREWLRKTVRVKSYMPNAFGLYDMHGNVWEWTDDCYNVTHQGAHGDGKARSDGDCSIRVLRGGSWFDVPVALRSAFRNRSSTAFPGNYFGFRLARTLP